MPMMGGFGVVWRVARTVPVPGMPSSICVSTAAAEVGRADDEAGEAAEGGAAGGVAGLHADEAGEGVEGLVLAGAGDEAGLAQVPPEHARFLVRGGAAVAAGDLAVAVGAAREGDGAERPARGGVGVVAGNRAVAVLVAVERGRDAGEVGHHVLDLRLRDHLLALEDAAEEQADDHQHDRDLDQGEAFCVRFHFGPLTGDGR